MGGGGIPATTFVPDNPFDEVSATTTVPPVAPTVVSGEATPQNQTPIVADPKDVVPSRIIQKPTELNAILLAGRSPENVMDTMINVLLDNYIYFVQFTGAPPLPADSIYGSIDVLGLSGQFGELTSAVGAGIEGKVPYSVEVMRISDPKVMDLIRDFEGQAMFGDYTNFDLLNTEQKLRLDGLIENKYAGHEYMFLAPAVDPDTGFRPPFRDPKMLDEYPEGEREQRPMIGIFPTYDGTNMGNISTIEEMMSGMPLDRQNIEFFMANLAQTNPVKFRAIQGQMSMLGFYPAGADGSQTVPTYGSYSDADRLAFFNFTADIMNEHIRVVDHNRKNPTAKLPSTTVESYLDNRFATIIQETTQASQRPIVDSQGNIVGLSPSQALKPQIGDAVESLINERWNPFGKRVTADQRKHIDQMFDGLYAEQEIDLTNITNENITGIASTNEQLALADAFGAEFYGGQDGWQENIRLGFAGTQSEFARLAKEAGVQYELGNPTTEQKQNVYRWYMVTLLNKNNGDLERSANEFAQTFGLQHFQSMQHDLNFLNTAITNATKQGSYGNIVGARTLEEQGAERLESIQSLSNRLDRAVNFAEPKDDAREQIVNSMISDLQSDGNQRRARGL